MRCRAGQMVAWSCVLSALLYGLPLASDTGGDTAGAGESQTTLTVGAWGGPYEAAQRAALFDPFERASGVRIDTVDYSGGLDVFEQSPVPDIVDMLEEEAAIACQSGLLQRMDHESLESAVIDRRVGASDQGVDEAGGARDGFSEADFQAGAFAPCSVAHLTFSTLVAYDDRAFPVAKPRRIGDLFDLQRFPGKRALQRSPAALFEWAMMAEGVPISQIYDLLSTERGLRLVLRRMQSLRGQVIWWDTPAEAVALLSSGEAVMASGYNGRFFDAWRKGAPINLIWDGQIIDRSVWAISRDARIDRDTALAFLRFALHPQRLAHVARQIPYGPSRSSAFQYIGLHPTSGIVMSDHLPTSSDHLRNALQRDTRWYARTHELRQSHFERWVGEGEAPSN